MKTPTLLAALLSLTLLAGCGVQGAPVPQGLTRATGLRAHSSPGWGKKTWATLTVSESVIGYALDEAAAFRKRFDQEYGGRRDIRLRLSLALVASQDGFRTRIVASNDQAAQMKQPQVLSFDLSGPAGEYEYYLMVTANVVEYGPSGSFRGIMKSYAPAHVSDFGKNFRARAD